MKKKIQSMVGAAAATSSTATITTTLAQALSGQGDTDNKLRREKMELTEIRDQYQQGWGQALEANMNQFLGKLAMQQKQLKEDLEDIMKRESQMVINAFTAGPYVRILDPVSCYYTLSESIV